MDASTPRPMGSVSTAHATGMLSLLPRELAHTAERIEAFTNYLHAGTPADEVRRRADSLMAEVERLEHELAAATRGAKPIDVLEDLATEEQLGLAMELLAAIARGRRGRDVAGKLRLVAQSIEAFSRPL